MRLSGEYLPAGRRRAERIFVQFQGSFDPYTQRHCSLDTGHRGTENTQTRTCRRRHCGNGNFYIFTIILGFEIKKVNLFLLFLIDVIFH